MRLKVHDKASAHALSREVKEKGKKLTGRDVVVYKLISRFYNM